MEELQMIGDMKKDEEPRPKSKLELLIEERDAKRRRISYRKKVHTNRKSHTEILQEVIQNQMELYEQIIKSECVEENGEKQSVDCKEANADEIRVKKNHLTEDIDRNSIDKQSVTDEHKKRNHREQTKHYSEDNTDHDAGRKNDKSDVYDDMLSEKSRLYARDGCSSSNSKRDSERNEKKNHKEQRMELKSFDKKYFGERHRYDEGTNCESKRNRRDHNKTKEDYYHYYTKRMHNESGSYSESKYYRNSSKYENVNEQYVDKYNYSRRYRNFSKRSEHYVEYEKDYYSHSRYQKNFSKHDDDEHNLKYEKEYAERSHKRKYNEYEEEENTGSHDKSAEVMSRQKSCQNKSAEDTYLSTPCTEFDKRSQHSDEKTNIEESHQRNKMLPDSQKNFEESRRMKKKKKKHHKHKSKKKSNKKKYHSNSSNSSSSESHSDSESP